MRAVKGFSAMHVVNVTDLPAGEGELTSEQLKAYLENLRPEDFGKFNP